MAEIKITPSIGKMRAPSFGQTFNPKDFNSEKVKKAFFLINDTYLSEGKIAKDLKKVYEGRIAKLIEKQNMYNTFTEMYNGYPMQQIETIRKAIAIQKTIDKLEKLSSKESIDKMVNKYITKKLKKLTEIFRKNQELAHKFETEKANKDILEKNRKSFGI